MKEVLLRGTGREFQWYLGLGLPQALNTEEDEQPESEIKPANLHTLSV